MHFLKDPVFWLLFLKLIADVLLAIAIHTCRGKRDNQ